MITKLFRKRKKKEKKREYEINRYKKMSEEDKQRI